MTMPSLAAKFCAPALSTKLRSVHSRPLRYHNTYTPSKLHHNHTFIFHRNRSHQFIEDRGGRATYGTLARLSDARREEDTEGHVTAALEAAMLETLPMTVERLVGAHLLEKQRRG